MITKYTCVTEDTLSPHAMQYCVPSEPTFPTKWNVASCHAVLTYLCSSVRFLETSCVTILLVNNAVAGAVELELCKRLKAIADADKTLDQYGIRRFAEAFDVVPRTLAENSGEWLLLLSCACISGCLAGVDCSFLVSTCGFSTLLLGAYLDTL
jgi:hypothetical protein